MSKPKIPVYVQTPEQEQSVPLGYFASPEEAIQLLEKWGLTDSDGEEIDLDAAVGDFVVTPSRVVFRISAGLE